MLKGYLMILTPSFYDILKIHTKKAYFQKFSWFQLYVYKLIMHDYVFQCSMMLGSSMYYSVYKLTAVNDNLYENDYFYFILKKFQLLRNSLREVWFLEEKYKLMPKILNLTNERAPSIRNHWVYLFNSSRCQSHRYLPNAIYWCHF